MGPISPPLMKAFFIDKGFKAELPLNLCVDGTLIIDLDILFNALFYTARTGDLHSLFTKMHAALLKDIHDYNEQHFSSGYQIRHLMLLITFDEEESGFLTYKGTTREQRDAGGMTDEQIKKRGPFSSWMYISDADEKIVRKTRTYKYWVYEQLQHMLFDEFSSLHKKNTLTDTIGLEAVHFIGYEKNYVLLHNSGASKTEALQRGEADVHLRYIPAFSLIQETCAIIYKTTDTDAFPICANLPRHWSFPHGFYINTGLQTRGKDGQPDVHLWVDMGRARQSNVDWRLFALCFMLMGNDFVKTISSRIDSNNIDRNMATLAEMQARNNTSFFNVIESLYANQTPKPPTKKAKLVLAAGSGAESTGATCTEPADAVKWNLKYWEIDLS